MLRAFSCLSDSHSLADSFALYPDQVRRCQYNVDIWPTRLFYTSYMRINYSFGDSGRQIPCVSRENSDESERFLRPRSIPKHAQRITV